VVQGGPGVRRGLEFRVQVPIIIIIIKNKKKGRAISTSWIFIFSK